MCINRFGPSNCQACRGAECKGGGNKKCVQRDPEPSVLAGILDTYGGLRFIVTHRRSLAYHVRHDELCIIVPDLTVHEPIAWGDIPSVVDRIELTVNQQIAQRGIPNEQHLREAITMYRLRQLEHPDSKRSLDLDRIALT